MSSENCLMEIRNGNTASTTSTTSSQDVQLDQLQCRVAEMANMSRQIQSQCCFRENFKNWSATIERRRLIDSWTKESTFKSLAAPRTDRRLQATHPATARSSWPPDLPRGCRTRLPLWAHPRSRCRGMEYDELSPFDPLLSFRINWPLYQLAWRLKVGF